MKKLIIICSLIMLAFLVVSCTKQYDCKQTIKNIVSDNRSLNATQIQELKQQDLNRIGSIFYNSGKGNQGINPPVSYFVINSVNGVNQYYYVTGGMYTEEWYGPYSGDLPTQCLPKGK